MPKYTPNDVAAWVMLFHLPSMLAKLLTDIHSKLSDDELNACSDYDKFALILLPKVEETVKECLSKLWDYEELGDRKPTDCLHHLQMLARQPQQTIGSPLIRCKFISSLPTSMKAPLYVIQSAPVRELAKFADCIWASNKSSEPSSSCYVSSANPFFTKSIASELAANFSKGHSNPHTRRFNNQQHNQHQNHRQSGFFSIIQINNILAAIQVIHRLTIHPIVLHPIVNIIQAITIPIKMPFVLIIQSTADQHATVNRHVKSKNYLYSYIILSWFLLFTYLL